jgi:uncharacterized protein (DUF952 family)
VDGASASINGAIFHAALPDDWAAALASGTYTTSTRGVTLAEEGFVHCAFRDQVEGVANRYYGDLTDLVLLRIDPTRVGAPVVPEPPAAGASELFPHVYGPIPVTAVVATLPWRRDDDGQWRIPPSA